MKNDVGEIISGIRELKRSDYGTGKFNGDEAEVDWRRWKTQNADEHGFDTQNTEENGDYWIETVLEQDTEIIRYGPENGRYTAPSGTDYDTLSLPYKRETVEFHKYTVKIETTVICCKVQKGIVAPMFDSIGGAVQYYHPDSSIYKLVRNGILERVVS